jgi:lipoprotein-releasing system permease protein
MTLSFYKYFIHYIVHAKTRQRLLFLAIVGLFLSSFALLVVQCIMGGLQKNLVARSKKVHGDYTFKVSAVEFQKPLEKLLNKYQLPFVPEYYIELLLKSGNFVSPVMAHGLKLNHSIPTFLQGKELKGPIVGSELGTRLRGGLFEEIELISPIHMDAFIGDIPRRISATVSDYFMSELSEIDRYHLWVRDNMLFNLTREIRYNRYRLYDVSLPKAFLQDFHQLQENSDGALLMKSWEQENAPLVWALNLERMMMVLLFTGMTLLVVISITSGLLIFFSKIKMDLMSFWILGMSKDVLMKLALRFSLLVNFVTCFLAIIAGLLFLFLLDHYAPNIMPDIFVERKLPVNITVSSLLVAFLVPLGISSLFSMFTFSTFRKENESFLKLLRGVV